jgi:ornithine cyclodeaminase/alanine dehydrogenase-like protein (mu-crystallin family)
VVSDLDAAVSKADSICTATSAASPLIKREFVRPGTHIDLVGGFRPEMQEAESEVLRNARIFVDDRANAGFSGDIHIPLIEGVITPSQIEADLFELCQMESFSRTSQQLTVYKNAGGAHLDLMVSQYVIERLNGFGQA